MFSNVSRASGSKSLFHKFGSLVLSLFTYLENRHVINIKDYGAVGDGVTDDTAAIEAAIAAAAALTPEGGRVYAPPGIYRFTNDIVVTSRVTIYGDGLGQASAASQSNAPTIFFKDGTGFTYGFDLQAYARLEQCQVLGNCVVEQFTATASQTVFDLATTTYTVGASNIKVSISNIAIPPSEYTETSTTRVTLNGSISGGNGKINTPLSGGEKVVIVVYKNDGDGVTFRGRGAAVKDVASTGHEGNGFRVGDSGGTNSNLWRANNIVFRDNGGHGFYNKGTTIAPDTNVGVMISCDGRDNGGDNIALEDTIDNVFVNVHTFGAAGHGVRCYGGAKGNSFLHPYNEDDFEGQGQLDSGATRNFIHGLQQGGSPWTINDTENYLMNHGDNPQFNTTMRFIEGYILNSAGVAPNYKTSAGGGYHVLEAMTAATSFITRFFTADGDGTDNLIQEIYAVGTSSSNSNRERMQIGYIAGDTEFTIKTNAAGTGSVRNLRIQAGDTSTNEITFQSSDVMLNLPEGIGDAANANIQAPGVGTGSGPSSLTVVKWVRVKVESDGQRYWMPLFQ